MICTPPLCAQSCRDTLQELAEKSIQFGMYFENESPPGWYIGKLVTAAWPRGKGCFWVNFTADGAEYTKTDDVKVVLAKLNKQEYQNQWLMVAPKEVKETSM